MDDSFEIRPAKLSDRLAIQRYLSGNVLIHRHLDWRQPLDWLQSRDLILYLNSRREIHGLFCCTPEIDSRVWIRIFSTRNKEVLFPVWHRLFNAFQTSTENKTTELKFLSLAYQPWMINLLELDGWEIVDTIVQFEWMGEADMEFHNNHQFKNIRRMRRRDLEHAYQIDFSSFNTTWQQSYETFVRSYNESGYATVYEQNRQIIAFQLSTISRQRSHLARIAVKKDFLRKGIGKALVRDFLRECKNQNIQKISVNTQQTNYQSIALYKMMGFEDVENSFPIFQMNDSEADFL
jgi:[ribosomal protein S18]-alanine N-acetyltransferase